MEFLFSALAALLVGGGLLAALIAVIIHPRVNQLISGEWLPDAEGAVEPPEAR